MVEGGSPHLEIGSASWLLQATREQRQCTSEHKQSSINSVLTVIQCHVIVLKTAFLSYACVHTHTEHIRTCAHMHTNIYTQCIL